MVWTQKGLLNGIKTYINDNLTDASEYDYIGLVPFMSSQGDYKNFVSGKFPIVGVSMSGLDYMQDGSLGINYPVILVQVAVADRLSGARPQDQSEGFLDKTENMQDLLLGQIRADTPFGLSSITAARLLEMTMIPTFVGQQDSNRKAFSIAHFAVELRLEDI